MGTPLTQPVQVPGRGSPGTGPLKCPSLCFVAHNAYGALAGVDTGHLGGIERQQSLMARWFAERGYPVSLISWEQGQADELNVGGVRIIKMCRQTAGWKGIRFVYPKWTSLCRAMKQADADIYYYNCGDLVVGQMVMWFRGYGRISFYSVASDPDCDANFPSLKPHRERFLYRHGVRHVERVIVQTRRQQKMLLEGFGKDSVVIPMPCEGPDEDHCQQPKPPLDGPVRILWVGRISREKRLEWLLDLAQQCPEFLFDVVGTANSQIDYAAGLVRRAEEIPNVQMHGRIGHRLMSSYYRKAHLLCNTSVYEGFPNTFLEAWSHGLPVITTFDPDGIVARAGLGYPRQSVDGLAAGLREAVRWPKKWKEKSQASRRYYLQHHTVDKAMGRFERIFLELVQGQSNRRKQGAQRA